MNSTTFRPALRLPLLSHKLRPSIPLPLVQLGLNHVARKAAQKHRNIFARLGEHSRTTYLIDPTDLSFVISLQLDPDHPQIRAHRRGQTPPHQARIAGTLRNLMKLIEGEIDGDALFFSRTLKVEGNTAAIVVLRNALDNMEGNFFDTAADDCGALSPFAHFALYKLRSMKP
jgi:predicted lipid carrier protein YhbT